MGTDDRTGTAVRYSGESSGSVWFLIDVVVHVNKTRQLG